MSMSLNDASIGEAYVAGMTAARLPKDLPNPYFQDTRQHAAYASGYLNEKVWMASHVLDNKEK